MTPAAGIAGSGSHGHVGSGRSPPSPHDGPVGSRTGRLRVPGNPGSGRTAGSSQWFDYFILGFLRRPDLLPGLVYQLGLPDRLEVDVEY